MNKLINFRFPLWNAPAEGAPVVTPAPAATPTVDAISGSVGDTPAPVVPAEGESAGGETESGEADKGKDADKADPPVAEPLTAESFTLPEGATVSEEHMNTFVETMNDADLSPAERGQKIIDLQQSLMEAASEQASTAAITAWDELQGQWQTELRALPEIGGENLDKSLASIKQGLEAAGATQETFDALTQTGAGNNPHLVSLLYKLTRTSVEGAPVLGNPAGGKLSTADRMFGGSSKKE